MLPALKLIIVTELLIIRRLGHRLLITAAFPRAAYWQQEAAALPIIRRLGHRLLITAAFPRAPRILII